MLGKLLRIDNRAQLMTGLRPVCPNCHAIIHCTMPQLTVEELRQ
jgi:predicted HNH restriction endonuclease